MLWIEGVQEGIRVGYNWINIFNPFVNFPEVPHLLIINGPWLFDQQNWDVPW